MTGVFASASSKMPTLRVDEFDLFYRSLHDDTPPYRWQTRAAAELASGRVWETLSAPTGAGKTTLVDCFLFALAVQAGRPERTLGRRLFWVVDRRSVVDQVYEYAGAVLERLAAAVDGPAAAAAARLKALGDGPPDLRLWRGGLTEEELAETRKRPLSPAACAIVCSTVDQIGSRLLFRGYGTSRRSRPLDAALTGTDALVVLDEAHISRPFLDTARSVVRIQRAHVSRLPELRVLAVSATPGQEHGEAFALRPDELTEEPLASRLRARKLARLSTGSQPERALAEEAARLARDSACVVGVVANTVNTARAAFDRLRGRGEALLVIGPCRPLDRAVLLDRIPPRPERSSLERPLFVVATQTIEVGLDLDLDALATECAPWPVLVQRLGRLDRAGVLRESYAVVVAPPRRCPVYGDATQETWNWLCDRAADGQLDLGPRGIGEVTAAGAPSGAVDARAPLLGHWHIDALTQTSEDPVPSPDVALFLHGERAIEAADVQVAWRADLHADAADEWEQRVRLRPPHPDELLSLPVWAARRLLAEDGAGPALVADVESAAAAPEEATAAPAGGRPAVRVPPRDPDGSLHPELLSEPARIRPGDVLVVPATYGHCDEFGWTPEWATVSRAEPVDLGNLGRTRPTVLVDRRVGAPQPLLDLAADAVAGLEADELDEAAAYAELAPAVREWLEAGGGQPPGSGGAAAAANLSGQIGVDGRLVALSRSGSPDPSVVLLPVRPRALHRARVSYEEHVGRVTELAGLSARLLELPRGLVTTIERAACWHDAGKLDRRFQAWLNGGAGAPEKPLAKSGRPLGDARDRRARVAAGWPAGARHEQLSAALAASVAEWPPDIDRDLLLHLVATHHGDGRPTRVTVEDPSPVDVAVCVDGVAATGRLQAPEDWATHAGRFLALTDRFGPWGLALLESILVVADRTASAEEAL